MWVSLYTDTYHPSQVWRQALPAACRTGLAKGLQAAGPVGVGKLANAEGRKTGHPCSLAAWLTEPNCPDCRRGRPPFFPFFILELVA